LLNFVLENKKARGNALNPYNFLASEGASLTKVQFYNLVRTHFTKIVWKCEAPELFSESQYTHPVSICGKPCPQCYA